MDPKFTNVSVSVDAEHEALNALIEALRPISEDKEAVMRVLWWARARFVGNQNAMGY